jgi:hypothetical protein
VHVTELERAHRANALFDAHRDDPQFGYRFLADEARDADLSMADRTAWRICSSMGWWSAFGRLDGPGRRRVMSAKAFFILTDLCGLDLKPPSRARSGRRGRSRKRPSGRCGRVERADHLTPQTLREAR